MFTASEIDLVQNCKLAPAAPNRRRPVILAEASRLPSHLLPPSFISKEQRFTVRPLAHIFCRALPHGWPVASLDKSTIWIWSYESCTCVHDTLTISNRLRQGLGAPS